MDYNIKKNVSENDSSGTKLINQPKSFQEKSIKRFKNKNLPTIDDNKNINRNYKIKKNYKLYDDQEVIGNEMIKNNHVRLDNKVESISYKTYNGDKFIQNVTYNMDRKFGVNTKANENLRNINNETKLSYIKPKDKDGLFKPRDYKSSDSLYDTKSKTVNRSNRKVKWNFLQESQLSIDKFEGVSDNNKVVSSIVNGTINSQRTSNNGLNPAATEFTPNTTISSVPLSSNESSNTIQQITDAIESGFKTLSFSNDNVNDTISNPVVIDTSEYSYTNPQLSMFPEQAYMGKLGLIDSSLIQSVYQCRPLSRLNYPHTQNIVPQIQYLYGTNPHMIRYNPTQNIPLNFQGNYILYNPMLYNGMYNATSSLIANRLVPIGATDIPVGNISTHIAHSFNPNVNVGNYSSSYYTDSMNNAPSHIR